MVEPATPNTPWRQTWDTTLAAFRTELAGSPVAQEADQLADSASPYGRLYLAHSFAENKHDTVGILIQPDMHNNLALRPRGYPEERGQRNGFAVFGSYADCLAAWRRRLTDTSIDTGKVPKNYVQAVTLLEYCEVYNPAGDTHPVTGLPNKPERYCNELLATINRLPLSGGSMPELNMTKGLIPMPPVVKRIIGPKPEGNGWNDLGPRKAMGFHLHRMQGTLQSTYDHFSNPNVRAMTDFGVDHLTGEVWQYNDPLGDRSGWASGPYTSQAYGDGRAFREKYGAITGLGADVINWGGVSWEISGYFRQPAELEVADSPWSDASIATTAQACAHYAHDYGIPWDKFPIAPQDGFSFVRWHNEFIGPPQLDARVKVPKVCPGRAVMDRTDAFIAATKEIMRKYQTGEISAPPPPRYAPLDPPPLEPWDGSDRMLGQSIAWAIKRTFTARKATPVHQYAARSSGQVRAPLAVGEEFDSLYWLMSGGEPWVVTASGARIPVSDSTPDVTFSTG